MGHTNEMKPGLRGRFILKHRHNTRSEAKGAIFCKMTEIYNQTLRVASNARLRVITSAEYNFTGREGVFNAEVCRSRAI